MIGRALGIDEIFEFSITPVANGEFRLDIRYFGGKEHNITGAGIWQDVQKAQEVATTIADKQLSGAIITWTED